MGDIGTKQGDNSTDIGYLRLTNLRIPRQHLFEKRQWVDEDGVYHKGNKLSVATAAPNNPANAAAAPAKAKPANDKMQYISMLKTRVAIVGTSAGAIANACTIVSRYSCVRLQGFKNTKKGQSYT